MRSLRIPATLAFVLASSAGLAQPAPTAAPDRSRPPEPGPVRPFHLPAVRRFTLANGLNVLLVEKHASPVASVLLAIRAGATADPAARPGLASMTAEMLDEGAAGKDALALDDAVSYLGADLKTSAGWDASIVSLHVPVARLQPALGLMADVALRPDFPEKEWDRMRRQRLTEILSERSEPDVIAVRGLARALFGASHRYGAPVDGTAEAIAALTVSEMKAFHAARFRPADSALFVAGDLTVETARPLLEGAFGSWKGEAAAPVSVPAAPQVKGRTIWLVDKPGAAQSAIRLGRPGPDRRTPLYVPIQVMNTLLGGSFTSRLNDNLREQHGWSYGAGSRFDMRRSGGVFAAVADVQTPATADALREFLKELERIGTPATPEEVGRARSFLAMRYAEQFETTQQLTSKLAETFIYGFPIEELESFVPAALAVSTQQVADVARKEIDPKALDIVVVGDLKVIEKPIRDLGAGDVRVRVVPIDDVMGKAPHVP